MPQGQTKLQEQHPKAVMECGQCLDTYIHI